MAIEIAEKTSQHPLDKFECTCPYCHSKISYFRHDIFQHHRYPLGYIDCPNCRHHLAHEETYMVEQGEGEYKEELKFDPRIYITKAQKTQYEAEIKKFKTSMTVLLVLSGVSFFAIFVGFIIYYFSIMLTVSDPGMGGGGDDYYGSMLYMLLMIFSLGCIYGGAFGFVIFLGLGLGLNIPRIATRNRQLRKKIWEDEKKE